MLFRQDRFPSSFPEAGAEERPPAEEPRQAEAYPENGGKG